MLHLFAKLTRLLICCNLIAGNLITTFAVTNATKAPAVTAILTSTNQHNWAHTWLRRQRRYLLFEKGSSVIVQGNIGKAILPERPRGLNEIYEYTFNYELPTALDMLRPKLVQETQQKQKHSKARAKSKQITVPTTKVSPTLHSQNLAKAKGNSSSSDSGNNPWLPQWHATPNWSPVEESAGAPWWQAPERRQWHSGTEQQQQQTQEQLQKNENSPLLPRKFAKMPAVIAAHPMPSTLLRQSSCPRRNVYGSWLRRSQRWCLPRHRTLGRGRKRSSGTESQFSVRGDGKKNIDDAGHRIDEDVDEFHFATNAERVFFDLLGKLADIHNYPPDYCVMRTLCESQHLLAAKGHSLFHDLLRILIDAALPAVRRHTTYKKAISHDNLSDCAQHYATLCGLSFLQHFTVAVHGRFM